MKKIYKLLLSAATIFCFIAIIFSFSEQSGNESHTLSSDVTEEIIRTIIRLDSSAPNISDKTMETFVRTFDGSIRKLAHLTIYFGLGFITTWLLWFIYDHDLHFSHIAIASLIVIIVGCGDEANQFFSGGRGSSIVDVMIDTCGGMLGIYSHFILRDFFIHLSHGIRKISKSK